MLFAFSACLIGSTVTLLSAETSGLRDAPGAIDPFKLGGSGQKAQKAERLLLRAKSDYSAGDYWGCSRRLFSLINTDPRYEKMDEALYLLGNSFYQLGMKEAASRAYIHITRRYLTSRYIPEALIGLQRIAYERGDFNESLDFYRVLLRSSPPQELINISGYYAGMAYYKLGDYPRCLTAFQQTNEKSPYRGYILYTSALALLRMKDVPAAVAALERLEALPASDAEQRRLTDEARLSMGYIYYEIGRYEQATAAFARIPRRSALYPESLLAKGWAEAQGGRWESAAAALTELTLLFPNHSAAQEGLFLLGRCYTMLGQYAEAIAVFDRLIDNTPDVNRVTQTIEKVNEKIARDRERLEARQMELLRLESSLMADLEDAADETSVKRQEKERRLKSLAEERRELTEQLDRLDRLARETAVKEERRNWRAYAEYGKMRAAFLQQQEKNRFGGKGVQ